jgi:hypothetical protein
MTQPTLEPLWHKATNQVGYRLSIEGVNKALFFGREELETLQSLITDVLKDSRERRAT